MTLKESTDDVKYHIDRVNIQNIDGNTTKDNLRNFDIDNYFSSEKIKNDFACQYVEIMKGMDTPEDYIPQWIREIKNFYTSA